MRLWFISFFASIKPYLVFFANFQKKKKILSFVLFTLVIWILLIWNPMDELVFISVEGPCKNWLDNPFIASSVFSLFPLKLTAANVILFNIWSVLSIFILFFIYFNKPAAALAISSIAYTFISKIAFNIWSGFDVYFNYFFILIERKLTYSDKEAIFQEVIKNLPAKDSLPSFDVFFPSVSHLNSKPLIQEHLKALVENALIQAPETTGLSAGQIALGIIFISVIVFWTFSTIISGLTTGAVNPDANSEIAQLKDEITNINAVNEQLTNNLNDVSTRVNVFGVLHLNHVHADWVFQREFYIKNHMVDELRQMPPEPQVFIVPEAPQPAAPGSVVDVTDSLG